jgi:flagellar protein FlaG
MEATMPRIDANVATQVADATRPPQAAREGARQAAEVRRQDIQAPEREGADAPKADEMRAFAERMRKVVESASGRQLDFALNERFKELVVLVKDRQTGETIREMPSKELMQLRERLDDLVGLFLDEKA